jgi:putative redox protein
MVEIDIRYEGNLSTRCIHQGNQAEIVTDAPKDNHGKGEMFSPTDLLAASLGSCLLTIMGIAAEKMKVDISGARVKVTKEMSKDLPRRIVKISVLFYCPKQFSSDITQKLESSSKGCPVHFSLHPDLEQEIIFTWGAP